MEEERLSLRVKNEVVGEGDPEYYENEIVKENTMLQAKYDELMKEIQEKSRLMENQLSAKDGTTAQMEQQIASDIEKQEKNVQE